MTLASFTARRGGEVPWGAGLALVGEAVHLVGEVGSGSLWATLLGVPLVLFPDRAWHAVLSGVCSWAFLFLLFLLWLRRAGISPRVAFPWRPSLPQATWMGWALGVGILPHFLGIPDADVEVPLLDLLQTVSDRVWLSAYALAVAPIGEEWLYRGLVFPGLAKKMGDKAAIVLVGMWFGLLHLPEYQGAPWGMASLCAFGLGATWLRAWTGGLLPSVVAHLVFNTVGVVGLWTAAP